LGASEAYSDGAALNSDASALFSRAGGDNNGKGGGGFGTAGGRSDGIPSTTTTLMAGGGDAVQQLKADQLFGRGGLHGGDGDVGGGWNSNSNRPGGKLAIGGMESDVGLSIMGGGGGGDGGSSLENILTRGKGRDTGLGWGCLRQNLNAATKSGQSTSAAACSLPLYEPYVDPRHNNVLLRNNAATGDRRKMMDTSKPLGSAISSSAKSTSMDSLNPYVDALEAQRKEENALRAKFKGAGWSIIGAKRGGGGGGSSARGSGGGIERNDYDHDPYLDDYARARETKGGGDGSMQAASRQQQQQAGGAPKMEDLLAKFGIGGLYSDATSQYSGLAAGGASAGAGAAKGSGHGGRRKTSYDDHGIASYDHVTGSVATIISEGRGVAGASAARGGSNTGGGAGAGDDGKKKPTKKVSTLGVTYSPKNFTRVIGKLKIKDYVPEVSADQLKRRFEIQKRHEDAKLARSNPTTASTTAALGLGLGLAEGQMEGGEIGGEEQKLQEQEQKEQEEQEEQEEEARQRNATDLRSISSFAKHFMAPPPLATHHAHTQPAHSHTPQVHQQDVLTLSAPTTASNTDLRTQAPSSGQWALSFQLPSPALAPVSPNGALNPIQPKNTTFHTSTRSSPLHAHRPQPRIDSAVSLGGIKSPSHSRTHGRLLPSMKPPKRRTMLSI
jgi:hypothetical protein